MEGDLIEPSIQEILDEEYPPTITQHLSLEKEDVKAIKESTKRRIVTNKQKIISIKERRSTKSNPTLPQQASSIKLITIKEIFLGENQIRGHQFSSLFL
ncbi:hypothetical protein AHAS_Ahas11G0132900 [Arachis hypogaea]